MKKSTISIVREQYRAGHGIYSISISLGISPKEVKECLTDDDYIHHNIHREQDIKDICDEIHYAYHLLTTGKGKIVSRNGIKFTQPISR